MSWIVIIINSSNSKWRVSHQKESIERVMSIEIYGGENVRLPRVMRSQKVSSSPSCMDTNSLTPSHTHRLQSDGGLITDENPDTEQTSDETSSKSVAQNLVSPSMVERELQRIPTLISYIFVILLWDFLLLHYSLSLSLFPLYLFHHVSPPQLPFFYYWFSSREAEERQNFYNNTDHEIYSNDDDHLNQSYRCT